MAGQVAHPESLVETDWVAEHLSDDSIRLVEVDVDLSSYAEAHIPSASTIPWGQAVNESDGTFKSVDELKALYSGKGITGAREVITHCRIGERSSHTWFALTQLLGYDNIRNYDGSWTEYGSMIGVPIEL